MPVKVRTIDVDELRDALRVVSVAFNEGPVAPDYLYDDESTVYEQGRFHVAEDDGAMVGTTCEYSLELSVPGGARLPMAGVSCVAVLPTHRRQGVLTELMSYELDAIEANGEPIAGLTASEATIYRRFGYGVATRYQSFDVHTPRADFLGGFDNPGDLRLITEAEGLELLPPVWERYRGRWAGAVSRPPTFWELESRDREEWRDNEGGKRYLVVHDGPAGVDGYAAYRIKSGSGAAFSSGTVIVEEVMADHPEIELALWRHCFDVDLTTVVTARAVRVEHPLPHRLTDPRCLTVTTVRDHLWLHLLDVPRCLEARTYGADGSVVIEVVDRFRPQVAGRYQLEASADGTACVRTTVGADLVLDAADLGALYLGGTSLRLLHEAGLVDERTPGAVELAHALFATEQAPWCALDF